MRRVVITGMGGVTALGSRYQDISTCLYQGKTAVCYMPEWEIYEGLHSRLAAPIKNFTLPEHYTRKATRSMGLVAKYATYASELALQQSGLLDEVNLDRHRFGVAYGSCTGSVEPTKDFAQMLYNHNTCSIGSNTYIQMMPHTTAVNISLYFDLKGRIIPTNVACASGSQAIGYAYEAIKYGQQDFMVAGGAEELSPTETAVFDTLFATSIKNDKPDLTPAPFDVDRDGIVLGEGACSLVLEEYNHAKARGAKVFAEIVGFACNSDATHVTQPNSENIQYCIEQALKEASLSANDISYINAHGTGTQTGDIAESKAMERIFKDKVPVSSLKGNFGHTLGACGSLEVWLSVEMMHKKEFAPTLNLKNVDPNCGQLDYIIDNFRHIDGEFIQSNNNAFGGINTSIILKRLD